MGEDKCEGGQVPPHTQEQPQGARMTRRAANREGKQDAAHQKSVVQQLVWQLAQAGCVGKAQSPFWF